MGEVDAQARRVRRSQNQHVRQSAPAVQQMRSPVQQNMVAGYARQVNLPSHNMLDVQSETAALEMHMKFAASDRLRKRRLQQSEKRYALQDSLRRKEAAPDAPAYDTARIIELEDAVKLSDEQLVKHYNESRTDDDEPYLMARYSILRNKYYSLLPVQELKEKPRDELMARLREEYAKAPDQRNKELIRFLQDIITVKLAEDGLKQKEELQGFQDLPREISDEEREYNASYYQENEAKIDGLEYLDDAQKQKHKKAMKRVMQPADRHEFWHGQDTYGISVYQKEGVRRILAWMYRNCNKSSESKEPFVYQLATASPEKVLYMLYLVENKMDSAPNTENFYRALTSYTPDLDKFKGEVIASKLKFWRRIGPDRSDSVIDWSKLGRVWHYVSGCDSITEYRQYEAEAVRTEHQLEQRHFSLADTSQERLDLLFRKQLIRGNKILALYRTAGLSPDMPPGLIGDRKLRDKVLQEIRSFRSELPIVNSLLGFRRNRRPQGDFTAPGGGGKPGAQAQGESGVDTALEYGNTLGTAVKASNSLMKAIDGDAGNVMGLTKGVEYATAMNGLGVITSIVGLISSYKALGNLAANFDNLTLADKTAQSLSVFGGLIGSGSGLYSGAGSIFATFIETGAKTGGSWIGRTTARTATEAFKSASGAVQFIAGGMSIVAGLATTVAGGVELGRAVSSRRDIERARGKLTAAEIQDNGNLTAEQQRARDHQQRLKKLMTHVDRMAVNQEKSAGVKMVTGAITMVGGALTMTGVAAPVGMILSLVGTAISFGYGVLYARHMKHMTQRAAVDDALGLDQKVADQRANNPAVAAMDKKQLEEFKGKLRQEYIARNGFATFKDFYADLSARNARMLYDHIFSPTDTHHDRDAYIDVVKALGLKIKPGADETIKNIPTVQMIYTKLMK